VDRDGGSAPGQDLRDDLKNGFLISSCIIIDNEVDIAIESIRGNMLESDGALAAYLTVSSTST
jgi:hypothetical protein